MKTRLELDAAVYEYLRMISRGYETGDLSLIFPHLSEDCVMTSQWVMTPNVGREAVTAYLAGKGETLRASGLFPDGSIQELVGHRHPVGVPLADGAGTVSLHYRPGEPCLLLEQTVDGQTNTLILRIGLDAQENICRIDLCMPQLFRYREFRPCTALWPCQDDEDMLDEAEIWIGGGYRADLGIFLEKAGEVFDEFGWSVIPMESWIRALGYWERFYSFESFDEAFEDACGICYEDFTVEDREALDILVNNGCAMWAGRENSLHLLQGLKEWTDKYKDSWKAVELDLY